MKKQIKFKCVIDCSCYCCGGATVLTLEEIKHLYKFFPITISFRKIYPFDSFHKSYIEKIAFQYRNFYIIGDFIAGNIMRRKCRFLKNSMCSIHDIKPLQCRVIPFSVTFPEEYQSLVISQKRKEAFRYCKGFNGDVPLIWDNRFIDDSLKECFYKLRDYIISQKDVLEKIFFMLKDKFSFKKFLQSEGGILEIPILSDFIEEICALAKIDNIRDFLKIQKSLFIKETVTDGMKNSLFIEALDNVENIKDLTENVKSYYD